MILENIPVLATLNIYSIIMRIILALVLGGLLGIEREQSQHPAGFRTYTIVCVGAALACITNVYMCEYLSSTDVARIPAQVISGMGFLGAGTILVTRNNHIRGLTTAAGLWCAATLGIAVGSGFYSGAIISSLVIVFSLRILSIVDKRFDKFSRYINVYAEFKSTGYIKALMRYTSSNGFQVKDLEVLPEKEYMAGSLSCTIKISKGADREAVIDELKQLEDLTFMNVLGN